ncbi:CLUMA_CG007441, isoform A [Clunio marinus]|uniref:CLUMA_CG007441, isoform A n=1 Tax=Clunio marinus TaxID=568069 RepID=A0A1J1I2B9_9DIPT|nr:CLUMA_CG007441, isoform A [Clunio marinus]
MENSLKFRIVTDERLKYKNECLSISKEILLTLVGDIDKGEIWICAFFLKPFFINTQEFADCFVYFLKLLETITENKSLVFIGRIKDEINSSSTCNKHKNLDLPFQKRNKKMRKKKQSFALV